MSIKTVSSQTTEATTGLRPISPHPPYSTTHLKTKIVCTIGPKTQTTNALSGMIASGMNVLRMNFSHGTHAFHQVTLDAIRSVPGGSKIGLMLDTKGPEIRTGKFSQGVSDVRLASGQMITLECDPVAYTESDCTSDLITVSYANLPLVVRPDTRIMIDDGLLELRVLQILGSQVQCQVVNGGPLGEQKGVNLPGVHVDLPAMTQKDCDDLTWGIKNGVDMIAASFIRRAEDVQEMRVFIKSTMHRLIEEGTPCYFTEHLSSFYAPLIIAKIENQQGLDNFDEIVEVADGVMVARGDLGVEIPVEQVCRAQKWIIARCNALGTRRIS